MPDDLHRRIGALKDGWRREFRELRVQITQLQERQKELRQKLNNADEILAGAKLKDGGASQKYANMGLRQAVCLFFTEHPHTQHGISDIKRRLEHEGMKTDARDLRANISVVCRRLENTDHFLTSELRDGTRLFRLKNRQQDLNKEQTGAGFPAPVVQSFSK
jgi:hypothetical protein